MRRLAMAAGPYDELALSADPWSDEERWLVKTVFKRKCSCRVREGSCLAAVTRMATCISSAPSWAKLLAYTALCSVVCTKTEKYT